MAMEKFEDFKWGTRGNPLHLDTRLPLFLFLREHDRGPETRQCCAADVVRGASEWLPGSAYRDIVKLDTTRTQALNQFLGIAASDVSSCWIPSEHSISKRGSSKG